jgi:DNA adenine methylase
LLPKSMKNKPVRSPLFYVGDKYKLIRQLELIFPDNIDIFYEPFTGGGSVGLNTEAGHYVFNDIDPNIVTLHEFLLESSEDPKAFWVSINKLINHYGLSKSFERDIVPDELKKQWKKTYFARFNKLAYEKMRADYNQSKDRSPILLYLLLIYGFNRMIRFNSSGQFNVPVGNVDFNTNVVESLNAYFDWAQHKKIAWKNVDCIDFLNGIKPSIKDFIYLDPPYLISFSEYNKLWDEDNEKRLLTKLDELDKKDVRFAISNITHYKGKTNQIFLDWSKKYKSHMIKSNYISYHDNSAKQIVEVVVTNYAN